MRWSQIFGRTLRQAPAGGGPSVALAQRAALVRLVDDTCVMLTLGHRLLNRIEASLRQRLPPAAEVRLPASSRFDADERQSRREGEGCSEDEHGARPREPGGG